MVTDIISMNNGLPEVLDNNQIIDLFKEFHNGSLTARNKIIEHNTRLIIRRIYDKFYRVDMDRNELFSIGCTGLIKAVNSYEIDRNISFATYATKCIDTEILVFLRDKRKDDCLISFETVIKGNDENDDIKLEDVVADDDDLVENYENKLLKEAINKNLGELDDRTQRILKLYYGFEGKCYTQREIGEKLNISRTLVCNTIEKGISILGKKLSQSEYISIKERKKRDLQRKSLLEWLGIDNTELEKRMNALTVEEKEIISLHYSNGYDKPASSKLEKQQKLYVYSKILPKLQPQKIYKKGISLCEYLGTTKEELEPIISKLCKYYQIILRMRYPEGINKRVFGKINAADITNLFRDIVPILKQGLNNQEMNKCLCENSIDVEKIMNLDYFKDLAVKISVKRALILTLTLGYVDGKKYDADDISKVLGLNKKDTINSIKKCLLNYKQYLDEYQKPIEKIR